MRIPRMPRNDLRFPTAGAQAAAEWVLVETSRQVSDSDIAADIATADWDYQSIWQEAETINSSRWRAATTTADRMRLSGWRLHVALVAAYGSAPGSVGSRLGSHALCLPGDTTTGPSLWSDVILKFMPVDRSSAAAVSLYETVTDAPPAKSDT